MMYWSLNGTQLHQGHVIDVLRSLDAGSVQLVVTSPPYWGLRDYGLAPVEWEPVTFTPVAGLPEMTVAGCAVGCEHVWGDKQEKHQRGKAGDKSTLGGRVPVDGEDRQRTHSTGQCCQICGGIRCCLGLESNPWHYVGHLVAVFREVRRALRDDGVMFLNLGDSYAQSSARKGQSNSDHKYKHSIPSFRDERYSGGVNISARAAGLKPKDLIGIPWRVAFALQADGWYLRSDIIWQKPNCMPESVTDRPTKAHEYVFLLAKSKRYFWDADAVREHTGNELSMEEYAERTAPGATWKSGMPDGMYAGSHKHDGGRSHPAGRNIRTVWTIPTASYPGAHFACVDSETEALTPLGWRRIDDLYRFETIVAYDVDTDCLKWDDCTVHQYPYNGEMISIEKNETSQLLTPNHRVLVRRRMGHQGRGGWGTDVKQADELKPAYELLLSAPFPDADYISGSIGEDMAELVGWYITDGYIKHNYQVGIDQSVVANPNKVERIRELLDRLDAEYTERLNKRTWRGRPADMMCFTISGDMAARLKILAPGKGKRMTPDLARLPMPEALALWRGLIGGDGHTRGDGRSCFVQKDRETIDLVQMLGVRLGYKTVLSRRKDGAYALYTSRKRWVTLRGTDGTHKPIPTKPYKGVVWCPHTSTGFWLARRHGKVFITGNTFPPALVRPMIKAGTSERGVCPECGSSWERVTSGEKYTPPVVEDGARHVDKSRGDKTRKLDGKSEEWKRAQASRTTTGWIPTCSCYGVEIPPKLHLPDLPEDARAPFVCEKCEGTGLEPPLPLMPDLETPCRKCKGRGERPGNAVWLEWKAECDEVQRNRLHVLEQIQGLDLPTVAATVLDPFAGSGTTAEVSIELGRKCILVEQSKAYCDEQIIPRLESPIAVRLI